MASLAQVFALILVAIGLVQGAPTNTSFNDLPNADDTLPFNTTHCVRRINITPHPLLWEADTPEAPIASPAQNEGTLGCFHNEDDKLCLPNGVFALKEVMYDFNFSQVNFLSLPTGSSAKFSVGGTARTYSAKGPNEKPDDLTYLVPLYFKKFVQEIVSNPGATVEFKLPTTPPGVAIFEDSDFGGAVKFFPLGASGRLSHEITGSASSMTLHGGVGIEIWGSRSYTVVADDIRALPDSIPSSAHYYNPGPDNGVHVIRISTKEEAESAKARESSSPFSHPPRHSFYYRAPNDEEYQKSVEFYKALVRNIGSLQD